VNPGKWWNEYRHNERTAVTRKKWGERRNRKSLKTKVINGEGGVLDGKH